MQTKTNNTITVNRLPSLTWNRLGVNHALVEFDAMPAAQGTCEYTERNVQQLQKETIPTKEANALADAFAGEIEREFCVAGKAPIYQEQAFATGMGKDFTDFIDGLVPETEVFTVPESAQPEEPVILRWDLKEGGKTAAQQVILAKKNSRATFLLVEESAAKAEGCAAFETKVIVEEGASLTLIKVNLLGNAFVLLDDTGAVLDKNASFHFVQLELGGAKNYIGCLANERGKSSRFQVDAGYMAAKENLVDINYVAVQRGAKTESQINVKGALKDQAKKTFRGTIDFRRGAKGAVGDEQEDVLLLDPKVINKTVPVILTEEEEVDGHHGATIGNLSEDILFYMGSRGLGKKEAEMLMTRGRMMSIAHLIPDKETVSKTARFVEEAFWKND